MKKKSLLAMSLMGLALVACSEDEQLNGGGTGNVNGVEGELAKVTLNVSVAAPQTKGNPDADVEQAGTAAESTVKNLVIVADYGAAGKEIRTAALASTTADSGEETSDEAVLEQVAGTNTYKTTITLPEGNPKFYVYANTDEITAETAWVGNEVSSKDASNYYDVTNSSFFMSTANGLGSTDVANEPISSDTEENLVDVDIERAAVKISVEVDQDAEATDEGADASDPSVEVGGESAGTIHSLGFAVKSVAKSFYLLCQASQAMPGNVEFDKTTTSADADFVNVDLTKSIWTSTNTIDNTYAAYRYCLENIQKSGPTNATYLNFKTTFTPKQKVVIAADDADDNDNFDYKVNGTTDVTLSGDEDTYPSFFVIRGASDGQYDNRYIMKSDLVGEDGQFKTEYGISAKATGTGYTVTGIEGITELSAEYTNGVCWFGPIYIPANARDNNDYSIYRNDWYHMTVTQITLPGLPTEPEGGDDDGDANVTVRASVLPWNFVATNLELGPNTQHPTE